MIKSACLVVIVVMVTIVVAATPPNFFQLLATLVCLFAVFAVAVDRIAQLVLGLMNLPFTFFVPVVVGPHGKRRTYQADNRQQCNAKEFESTRHRYLL
jgi:hypothetical protein